MSTLASKPDLAGLKTKEDNLDVDKLETLAADSSKPNNVADNDVIKKTMYDKFIAKVKAIDIKMQSISGLVTKTNYDSEKQSLEKKIGDVDEKIRNTSELIKNTKNDTKITNTANKIPRVTGLVTTDILNAKPISVSQIEKKSDMCY